VKPIRPCPAKEAGQRQHHLAGDRREHALQRDEQADADRAERINDVEHPAEESAHLVLIDRHSRHCVTGP
jgi:hypothetical protein